MADTSVRESDRATHTAAPGSSLLDTLIGRRPSTLSYVPGTAKNSQTADQKPSRSVTDHSWSSV